MKALVIFIAVLPFWGFAQKIKVNEYDKFIKQRRVEAEPLSVLSTDKSSVSISYMATGGSLHLFLSGYGWGAATVDGGSEVIFLFSNDNTIAVKSTGLQTYEMAGLRNNYKHEYTLTLSDLDALSRNDVVGIRKYSFKDYADLKVSKEESVKIRKLSNLFIEELKKAKIIRVLSTIDIADAVKHVGDSVRLCGRVLNTRHDDAMENGSAVLEINTAGATQPLNIIIPDSSRKTFRQAPEKLYNNRDVCIRGVIQSSTDADIWLVIYNQSQIDITSAIGLEEVSDFVDDSVTVTGTVTDATYFPEAQSSPTILGLGTNYSNQRLALMIDKERRPGFEGKPEELYLNRNVEVKGKVVLVNNKPQITIYSANQIKVINMDVATVKTEDAVVQNNGKNTVSSNKYGAVMLNSAANNSMTDTAINIKTKSAGTGSKVMSSNLTLKAEGVAIKNKAASLPAPAENAAMRNMIKVVLEKEPFTKISSAETKAEFPGGACCMVRVFTGKS